MKCRNGFVSNSSSSSFIVAVKNDTTTKVTITKEIDLSNYTRQAPIKTAEDFYEYYKDVYGDKSYWGEGTNKRYKNALKELANGKSILVGSFCSDGDSLESFLCDEGLKDLSNKDIVIIDSEGGY